MALLIAALTSALSTLIGASLGILSGYAAGVTDAVIQRASDIVSNVPTLPLLIFLVSILGRHLWLIMLVLVAFSWPGTDHSRPLDGAATARGAARRGGALAWAPPAAAS